MLFSSVGCKKKKKHELEAKRKGGGERRGKKRERDSKDVSSRTVDCCPHFYLALQADPLGW